MLIPTYPQAIAGTPIRFSYDPSTAEFALEYRSDPGIHAPTRIFVPVSRAYPDGYGVVVEGPARVVSAPNAPILLLETIGPGQVTVRVTRA